MSSQEFQEQYIDKIICGDALKVMAGMPDECVDLVITSPPYNLGNDHQTHGYYHNPYGDDMPEPDYQSNQIRVINECLRILKADGSLFYNHKNRIKDGLTISPYVWILESNAIVKQEIVWYNGTPNFDKVRYYPATERFFWLAISQHTRFRNYVNSQDLWHYSPVGTSGEHKRAFPVQMIIDILDCFPVDIVVLDPYMGSGTVAIACQLTGRHYLGIDNSDAYCQLSRDRIAGENAQLKLDLKGGE